MNEQHQRKLQIYWRRMFFYEDLHAVQEKLSKFDNLIVIGDLNAKADNPLPGYVVGRNSFGVRSNNDERSADFCNFAHFFIGGLRTFTDR